MDDRPPLAQVEETAPPERTDLREYLWLAPRLIKLLWRLMRDPRVPARTKAMLVLLGVYLVTPIDVIPDALPGIGQVDDLILVAFALDQMLNRIPNEVVRDHWDGDEDVLEVVKNILDIATAYIPSWVKKRFSSS